MKLPKISIDLLVQDFNDEVLIYDTNSNKSYCLNSTARTVFNACNGETAIEDLKLPEEIIYLALDELRKNNLVEDGFSSPLVGMSRREAIRKVGIASMIALPVISAVVAPTAATAASGSTCAGTCIGPGVSYCVGKDGQQLNIIYYSSTNSSCSGPLQSPPATITCPTPSTPGGTPRSAADRCIS